MDEVILLCILDVLCRLCLSYDGEVGEVSCVCVKLAMLSVTFFSSYNRGGTGSNEASAPASNAVRFITSRDLDPVVSRREDRFRFRCPGTGLGPGCASRIAKLRVVGSFGATLLFAAHGLGSDRVTCLGSGDGIVPSIFPVKCSNLTFVIGGGGDSAYVAIGSVGHILAKGTAG